jgi:hypothetical protein
MFDKYRIPKDNLLNRTGDVTEDGKYVSPYSDPNKRFGKKSPFAVIKLPQIIILFL